MLPHTVLATLPNSGPTAGSKSFSPSGEAVVSSSTSVSSVCRRDRLVRSADAGTGAPTIPPAPGDPGSIHTASVPAEAEPPATLPFPGLGTARSSRRVSSVPDGPARKSARAGFFEDLRPIRPWIALKRAERRRRNR